MKQIKIIVLLMLVLSLVLGTFTSCDVINGLIGNNDGGDKVSCEHAFENGKCLFCGENEPEKMRDAWAKRVRDAAEAIEIRDASNLRGTLPLCAKRILGELRRAKTDWRTILNEFVQEEIVDYSFCPPDRRFDGGDFFLPDFNEKDDKVENILFMVDIQFSCI